MKIDAPDEFFIDFSIMYEQLDFTALYDSFFRIELQNPDPRYALTHTRAHTRTHTPTHALEGPK